MGLSDKVIGIALGIFLMAILGGVAIQQFYGTNTTTWDATTILVWNLTPVIALVAVFMGFVYYVKTRA